jgi:RES domain-containing protein
MSDLSDVDVGDEFALDSPDVFSWEWSGSHELKGGRRHYSKARKSFLTDSSRPPLDVKIGDGMLLAPHVPYVS